MTTPLPGLLSQVLIGLAKDYDRTAGAPPLPLWLNFLRVVPDAGLRRSDLAREARISRRAIAAILTGAVRSGLVAVEQSSERGGAVVRLTEAGLRARENGRAALLTTEANWLSGLGEVAEQLRDAARSHVRKIDLELPHFPLGYGPVDDSMTGGRSRQGSLGPPRIPSHGEDWVPVVREGDSTVEDIPIAALLSQILVAFAIDFEQDGSSLPTTVIWREFPDDGLRVADLPDGCPNPSGWERHGLATLDPTPLKKSSVIKLTFPARTARDGYTARSAVIEEEWRHRFGRKDMTRLRKDLETVVEAAAVSHLPHFPRVSWIGGLRELS